MIAITLNGAAREVTAADLSQLLAELGHAPDAPVATALNGAFVPRTRRAATTIKSGDRVEVARPMSGG